MYSENKSVSISFDDFLLYQTYNYWAGKSIFVSKLIFSCTKQLKNCFLAWSLSQWFMFVTQSTWNNQEKLFLFLCCPFQATINLEILLKSWAQDRRTEDYIHYTVYIISLLFTANKDKLINFFCVITGPYGGPGKVFQGGGEIWLLFINLLLAQIECFYHHREHTIFIQTWEMWDWVFVLNNIMSVESAELYHSSKDAKL